MSIRWSVRSIQEERIVLGILLLAAWASSTSSRSTPARTLSARSAAVNPDWTGHLLFTDPAYLVAIGWPHSSCLIPDEACVSRSNRLCLSRSVVVLDLGEGQAGMPIRWTLPSARDRRTAAASVLAAWLLSVPFAHAQTQPCTPVMAGWFRCKAASSCAAPPTVSGSGSNASTPPLCQGDLLRTGPNSRAALFIPPENLLRVDQNTTVSVHVEQDETVIEFFIDETTRTNACGAGYAISRFPRKFKINTPFSYAAVEGTEFLVALSCTQATVSVFEGKVSVEQRIEQASKVVLGSGQTTSVGPGQPPWCRCWSSPPMRCSGRCTTPRSPTRSSGPTRCTRRANRLPEISAQPVCWSAPRRWCAPGRSTRRRPISAICWRCSRTTATPSRCAR